MAWYDVLADAGGLGGAGVDYLAGGHPVTGAASSLGSLKNTLEGDPASVTAALQKMQQQAIAQGNQIKNFLLGRESNAEQYYQPMRQMFSNMYGTGGIKPFQVPGVPKSIGGGG
jgi:hypothetical protein